MIFDGSSPFLIASIRMSRLSPVTIWASLRVSSSLLLSSVVVMREPWLSIALVRLLNSAPRGAINVASPKFASCGGL